MIRKLELWASLTSRGRGWEVLDIESKYVAHDFFNEAPIMAWWSFLVGKHVDVPMR